MYALSAQLKSETSEFHKAVESAGLLRRLISPRLTYDDYRRIMRVYLTIWAALEPAAYRLDWLDRVMPDPAERRRLPALEADCRVLNVEPTPFDELPGQPALPEMNSAGAALGCLYVLEGSALGGLVILRHLQRTLGLGATTGAGFFAGSGRNTLPKWRGFLDRLDELPLAISERTRVIGTAGAVFQLMSAAFAQGEFNDGHF